QASYAAARERERLGIGDQPLNVFRLLSLVGVNIFRRKLEDPRISSLFFRHPSAGVCILVNKVDDHYRERYSAAHEYAHALLDPSMTIHFSRLGAGADRQEQRANIFAGHLLIPPAAFEGVDPSFLSDPERLIALCKDLGERFLVNGMVILLRLLELNWLQQDRIPALMGLPELRAPLHPPFDPVLPFRLPSSKKKSFQPLLDRGISWEYMTLVVRGFREGVLSRAKMGEMLMTSQRDAFGLAQEVGLL
ncbi:MAG TPA: ImmA/IrrE family metallo-endopeptidase, partial [Chroococcales cyanobacterium]